MAETQKRKRRGRSRKPSQQKRKKREEKEEEEEQAEEEERGKGRRGKRKKEERGSGKGKRKQKEEAEEGGKGRRGKRKKEEQEEERGREKGKRKKKEEEEAESSSDDDIILPFDSDEEEDRILTKEEEDASEEQRYKQQVHPARWGKCHLCQKELFKGHMVRHLITCIPEHLYPGRGEGRGRGLQQQQQQQQQQQSIHPMMTRLPPPAPCVPYGLPRSHPEPTPAEKGELNALDDKAHRGQEKYFLLLAEAGPYWLYIVIEENETLKSLDSLLRKVWCECCGHLSAFRFQLPQDDPKVSRYQPWRRVEYWNKLFGHGEYALPMKTTLFKDSPFAMGRKGVYKYDFGTATEFLLWTVAVGYLPKRSRKTKNDGVCQAVGRNNQPRWLCSQCTEPARKICSWRYKIYCKKHFKEHEHGAKPDCLLPVVNSPRMGECG